MQLASHVTRNTSIGDHNTTTECHVQLSYYNFQKHDILFPVLVEDF